MNQYNYLKEIKEAVSFFGNLSENNWQQALIKVIEELLLVESK